MITKKRVILHILWGSIFGLISGIIVAYNQFIFAWIYKLDVYKISTLRYSMEFSQAVTLEMFNHFYKNILEPVNLIVLGIFIGFTLGIAGKSLRKSFYGILGGMLGAILYYVLYQKMILVMHYSETHRLFSSGIEVGLFIGMAAIPIALFTGIVYRSLKKIMLGTFGGVVGWIGVIFCWLAMDILGLKWTPAMGSGAGLLSNELCDVIMGMLIVVLISVGIFIGTELGEKEYQQNLLKITKWLKGTSQKV